jgi:predicted negative regulator of RcsB-dependent stress response
MSAVETTKETLYEAEVNRMAGEIAATEADAAKAQAYFQRALAVARQQGAAAS